MTEKDSSGKTQIERNVVTSWLSHLIFIVFGFVLPRAINDVVGQGSLGIWDFSWSVVSYLNVAMLGVGSSVNRYVARYRASGDTIALSKTVSSVIAIQLTIAALVFVATVVITALIPKLLSEQLGEEVGVTTDVVFLLGISVCVQMMFDAFRGIITGCHKWTAYNILNAGGYSLAAASMLFVLVNGGGLRGMALAFVLVTLATELVRVVVAIKACPEIEYRWKHVNRKDSQKVFKFGIKTTLIYLPKVIIQQTVNVGVLASLGPASLAVLARPMALIGHLNTLINKFAFVLTPTTSSLQGSGRVKDLKEFALSSARAAWVFTVIPCVFLMSLGDVVIEFWMGPGYADWAVIATLAVGSMLPLSQSAAINTLIGMDEHGKIAKWSIVVSTVSVAVGFVIISFTGWSLVGAALLNVGPMFVGIGAVALVVGCRVLDISAPEYFKRVLRDPIILMVSSGAILYLVRLVGPQSTGMMIALGLISQSMVALVILRNDLRTVSDSLFRGRRKSRNANQTRVPSGVSRQNGRYKIWANCLLRRASRRSDLNNSMTSVCKKTAYRLLDLVGVNAIFRWKNRHRVRIFTVHGVVDHSGDHAWRPLRTHIDTKVLRRNLTALSRDYDFVSIDEVVDIISGRKKPRSNVISLTFDDGYANNFSEALPVLRDLDIPGVFYLATGFIEARIPYWFDRLDFAIQVAAKEPVEFEIGEKSFKIGSGSRSEISRVFYEARTHCKDYFTDESEFSEAVERLASQLEECARSSIHQILEDDQWSALVTREALPDLANDPCVTLGGHTVSHIRLSFSEAGSVERELEVSKRKVAEWSGLDCLHFAYPNGDSDSRSASLVKQAGYKSAVTTDFGMNAVGADLFTLARMNLPESSTVSELRARASGLESGMMNLKRSIRRLFGMTQSR